MGEEAKIHDDDYALNRCLCLAIAQHTQTHHSLVPVLRLQFECELIIFFGSNRKVSFVNCLNVYIINFKV